MEAGMKVAELTFEQLDEVIAYDPDAGTFTWKISTGKNIKAGVPAGAWKGSRNKSTGDVKQYLYIIYLGREMTASRVAWLFYYREWPTKIVQFIDGDNTNFKISNLKLAMFESRRVAQDGRIKHRMSTEASRHYGLKRHYGITMTEYTEMYNSQHGKCAICGNPETTKLHGKIRDLSVDHCHTTGKVRQLLCNACNHILGEAKENVKILLAAAAYIEKHSAKSEDPGSLAPQTGPADTARIVGRNLVQEEG
jgi:hypothetical protein